MYDYARKRKEGKNIVSKTSTRKNHAVILHSEECALHQASTQRENSATYRNELLETHKDICIYIYEGLIERKQEHKQRI